MEYLSIWGLLALPICPGEVMALKYWDLLRIHFQDFCCISRDSFKKLGKEQEIKLKETEKKLM